MDHETHEPLTDCDCQACAVHERDRLRRVLLTCARKAEALKRDCSADPDWEAEFQQTENARYQDISTTAHIALGTIKGPHHA